MRVDQQNNFGVQIAERRVSGKWNVHQISHAAHVHNNLIGLFFRECSAKLRDHSLVLTKRQGESPAKRLFSTARIMSTREKIGRTYLAGLHEKWRRERLSGQF